MRPAIAYRGGRQVRAWVRDHLAPALVSLALLQPCAAPAAALPDAGIDPQPGAALPRDAMFQDAAGHRLRLADLPRGTPLLLVPSYYHCPNLCSVLLDGVIQALVQTGLVPGRDYQLVALGIDHREGPADAAAKRAQLLARYGQSGTGWRFLTGSEGAVRAVADTLGYRFTYDPALGQYAHAAAIATLTPQGRVAHYLFGVRFEPRDLRLALVEAADGRVGGLGDRVLLLCYGYDPQSGRYTLAVMNLLRLAGAATVLGLLGLIWTLQRRAR